ncbi:MAG: molybdopterin-dependent oxidoreductase [Thermodesulfovibrionales bacterium]
MEKGTKGAFGRRGFLRAAALLSLLSWLPSPVRAFFIDRLYVRTVEKDTFRFDPETGNIRWTNRKVVEPYLLTVEGLVEQPLRLSYADLTSFVRASQVSDFHCVEGWSVAKVQWAGFRFQEIVKRARPKPGAAYAVFHALGETADKPRGQDHYIESHPVRELLDPAKECLLTLFMGGKPLPHDHGAPLRLIAPYSLGYKNIKYIHRIEFAREPRPGWWTLANSAYPVIAPVPADRLRKKERKK